MISDEQNHEGLERLRKTFYSWWKVLKEYREHPERLEEWRKAPKGSIGWRKAKQLDEALEVLRVALSDKT